MRDVYIIGIGMTRFAKHLDRTGKDLVAEAFAMTMDDATEVKISDIQSAFFSNTAWGTYCKTKFAVKGSTESEVGCQ